MEIPDQQQARELQVLRDAIALVTDPRLKAHMQRALDAFTVTAKESDTSNAAAVQTEESANTDQNDTIMVALRTKNVATKTPRDALFLAVHAVLIESGFSLVDAPSDQEVFPLPANWDAHSANGLFVGVYKHPNDPSITFNLQGLFVGNKFEVYVSDSKNHTHSIELSTENYVSLSATATGAADLLRDLAALRLKLTPFFQNITPKRPVSASASASAIGSTTPPPPPSSRPTGDDCVPSVIPDVGSGDILPPAFGGGDPSSQVGPDHPMFDGRHGPPRGGGQFLRPRFDPFGPLSTDPMGPRGGFGSGLVPPHPGSGPGFPFGDPNPDHMRIPHDDDMDDPFAMPGNRRGPGGPGGFPPGRGSGGPGFGQPFGSDRSFF